MPLMTGAQQAALDGTLRGDIVEFGTDTDGFWFRVRGTALGRQFVLGDTSSVDGVLLRVDESTGGFSALFSTAMVAAVNSYRVVVHWELDTLSNLRVARAVQFETPAR